MKKKCPCCGKLCKNDVTIEDHGRCIDCHHEIIMGERCAGCWEYGHAIENCPDNEKEQT